MTASPTDPARAGASAASSRLVCPVCAETRHAYLFVVHGLSVVRCRGCGLIRLGSAPAEEVLRHFYGHREQGWDPGSAPVDSLSEQDAERRYVQRLRDRGFRGGRLMVLAAPDHPFVREAAQAGFEIAYHRAVRDFEQDGAVTGPFDAVAVLNHLEKAAAPGALLERLHDLLADDGLLLVATASVDTWPVRVFEQRWTEWRPENLFYFNRTTAHALLLKHGFGAAWIEPDRRLFSLQHIADRSAGLPRSFLTRLVAAVCRLLPAAARDCRLHLGSSNVVITARRRRPRARPLLSIVLPVYNEKETFRVLMDALVSKPVEGVDKEIIVVESNSRDGTREEVLKCREMPGVQVVLQDRPRGKGFAVREGIRRARGDIVMIQDADLEYDLNDYEALLAPLLAYHTLFVLGARHGGNWKMRRFANQPLLSTAANLAHVFFTALLNALYGQRMKDPLTMFKVFYRDCVFGVGFECNQFDFDHELVIKLLRRGYTPVEVPVNYWSRSFKEGKKIKMFPDPLIWLWTDIKYRFTPLQRVPEADEADRNEVKP